MAVVLIGLGGGGEAIVRHGGGGDGCRDGRDGSGRFEW